MKKLLLKITVSIIIITLGSCSSNSDENPPNLSFNIEAGNRWASSEINITNTSTNYSGNYVWEVTTSDDTEIYNSQNLTFYPELSGEYNIKLKTSDGQDETSQALLILRPTRMVFDQLTIRNISQDYESLYFKIYEIDPNNGNSYRYTSQPSLNVSSSSPNSTNWDISFPENTIHIVESNIDMTLFIIEFYDVNDNLIAEMNGFTNWFSPSARFFVSDYELMTNCSGCDNIEILLNVSFGQ